MFEHLLAAAERGQVVQTVTLIDAPKGVDLGQMLLMYPDGSVDGCLVNDDFSKQVQLELSFEQWQKPQVVSINYQQQQYRVFWQALTSKNKAIILGAGHISQPLAQFLSMLDYQVTVIDDRPDFANQQRFPHANQVICQPFAMALNNLQIDDRTAVIIVTRGHRYDLECLQQVIDKPAGYLGMIGSRRRVRGLLELLQQQGVNSNLLQAVKTPIGLDIGAQTPAEIALSIAAEIVVQFKGGSCLPLSGGEKNG